MYIDQKIKKIMSHTHTVTSLIGPSLAILEHAWDSQTQELHSHDKMTLTWVKDHLSKCFAKLDSFDMYFWCKLQSHTRVFPQLPFELVSDSSTFVDVT